MPEKINVNTGDKVLICRTDRIGDLILTIPLIESMKLRYPDCPVDVLASDYAAPILENNPHVNEIIPLSNERLRDDWEYFRDMISALKEKKYSAALAVFPDRRVARLIYKAGIPNRVGTARRFHSIYFNRYLFHSRKKSNRHESEYNLDFLRFFQDGPTKHTPEIYITDAEKEKARQLLQAAGIKGPFAVIHPGSKGSAPAWPVRNFARLYKLLTDNEINVILTGASDEISVIDNMANESGQKINSLAGRTDLRSLAAVLSLAELIVANSTGPLHMAAASGTQVVGFYPNERVMSAKRWGPLGIGHKVFTPESGNDMESITVERVAQSIIPGMKRTEAAS